MEKKLHEISLRSGAGDTFSGVSKNKKGKALSMKQRRRKEMGMEKALQASERLVKKVEGSKKRAGMVAERRVSLS